MSTKDKDDNVIQLDMFNKDEDRFFSSEVFSDDHELSFLEYQDWAQTTLGPDANPLMISLGVGGEAGEVLEVVKKGNRPGQSVDIDHLKEEIGDLMWYLANLATYYDIDLEEAMFDNMDKLEERYGEKT